MKKVYIIHGWGGAPQEGWYPWIKKELESKGYAVDIPTMPNTDEPTIEEWTSYMKEQVSTLDKETYFVGHSIGCQAILRYLEKIEEPKIGGMVLVAPWMNLTPVVYEEEGAEEISKPWRETPINWEKVKSSTENITAIFSDNDPFIPLSDSEIFKEKLGAEIVIEHGKEHMQEEHGIMKLPVVLEKILSF
ncbi:MAG: serine hydrolase family protein [Candidatus Aenigmarchaeota archaeon]|nr:serine hydrolase family protein [Candidatus Aenigmarchaeota archaeon]